VQDRWYMEWRVGCYLSAKLLFCACIGTAFRRFVHIFSVHHRYPFPISMLSQKTHIHLLLCRSYDALSLSWVPSFSSIIVQAKSFVPTFETPKRWILGGEDHFLSATQKPTSVDSLPTRSTSGSGTTHRVGFPLSSIRYVHGTYSPMH
jgi:hypothetical protein